MKIQPDTAYFQARLHLQRAKDYAGKGDDARACEQIDAALSMLRRVEPALRVRTETPDAAQ